MLRTFALLGTLVSPWLIAYPLVAQTNQPASQSYPTFADWCTHRDRLTPAHQHTVDVLLQQAQTSDCDRAQATLSNRTTLHLANQNLQALGPIATFTQLTFLNLSNNDIQDLHPLSRLSQLQGLSLGQNQVQDLSPLSALTQLQDLDLSGNQLETVDFPALAALENLVILRLRDNPIQQKVCPVSPQIVCHFDDTAPELWNQAAEAFERGDLTQAIAPLQQALKQAREHQHLQVQGLVLDRLGEIYAQLGDYAQALETQQQAQHAYQAMGDRLGETIAQITLGELHERLGLYEAVIQDLEQAEQRITALNRAAQQGDRELTILAYHRWGETPDEYHINIYRSLARIYSKQGDNDAALQAARSALALSKDYNQGGYDFSVDIALAWDAIGVAQLRLGEPIAAAQSLEQALAIVDQNQFLQAPSQQSRRNQLRGQILKHLADVQTQQGDLNQAEMLYRQALSLHRQAGDRLGEGETLHELGALLLAAGRYQAATETLQAAANIWETTRVDLTDAQKVALADRQAATYLRLQEALVGQNQILAALEVAERSRARAFAELLNERLTATDAIAPPTIEQLQAIAQAQQSTIVEYTVITNQLIYIWVIEPTGAIHFRTVAATEAGKSLPQLVRRSRRSLGRVRSLASTASQAWESDLSLDVLQQLHHILIHPIQDLLPTDPDAPVIFVPHQTLFLVPFPALQNPNGDYLIEHHTILTAPSIQSLQLTRAQHQRLDANSSDTIPINNALIVGNPTMPSLSLQAGIPPTPLLPLPGAEQEAAAIAALLDADFLTGDAATETAVNNRIEQAQLVHFATHGLIDYGARQGEVRLDMPGALAVAPEPLAASPDDAYPTPGLLTAREILDLNLQANLVVLSACDTGRGEITSDGVIGLSRAFITAGTPSIIVSLWAIPDAPTMHLMTTFYKQWQASGNKAQALRQAMLTTMAQYPAPRDWAAFTLIGEAQ